ncbi:MAG: ABC transporter permease subunit [Ardenticatenales bacterium]|nr:ABC transporter permease subunit [Ardenticatenales bacterium]
MAEVPLRRTQQSVPFWRDVKIIAILLQVLFVIVVLAVTIFLYTNMVEGLRRSNLLPNLSFLNQSASIAIGEGLPYTPSDTWRYAFLVGVVNTLRIAIVGVILATLLGLVVGISRLSNNWLLRNVAYTYIEIVRNIPLLVQLIFWATVAQNLPTVQNSINLGGLLHLTNRGVFLAWPRGSESMGSWVPWLYGALVAGVALFLWRRQMLARLDRPGAVLPLALLGVAVVALLGFVITWIMRGVAPLYLDVPLLDRFNFKGGTVLTSQFSTLLFGLVIYTASFISEIVRAGIQAVSKGQREAARALGLSDWQSLRLVVLPQALRIMIPPMTNQYLNLSKNSSLAFAIGYPDLFTIGSTINNQTGQIIPPILMIMGSYLTISLTTSLAMNLYNRRIQLHER